MHRFVKRTSLILLMCLASPNFITVVRGNEIKELTKMSLEDLMKVEVVYGASKADQTTAEAPAMVTLITAEEIHKQGFRTLADILDLVRGLYITDDREYNYLGMRGFGRPGDYLSRFLLLLDGHRLNETVYDSFGLKHDFFLDLDLIERIEVIRGPASSLYGSNAFFGVINIVTKQASAVRPALMGEAGSHKSYRRGAIASWKSASGWEGVAEGSDYDSSGEVSLYYPEYDAPETNNGRAVGTDWERGTRAFAKIGKGDFVFCMAMNSRVRGIPTGAYDSLFNDPRNSTGDQRSYAELRFQHVAASGLENQGRISADHTSYHGIFVYGDAATTVVNNDHARGDWWGVEWNTTLKPHPAHRATLGLEYRDNFRQDQYDYEEGVIYLDSKHSSKTWGLLGQEEWKITRGVLLNVGARYDRYETFGGNFAPRAALILRPKTRTTVKWLYGEAFRIPNTYEMYYDDNGTAQKGNPNLQPEQIQTFEVGVDQVLDERLTFTLGAYHYKVTDLINQVLDEGDGLLYYDNTDAVKADGVESLLRWLSSGGIGARASYCWQLARDWETGSELTNSPRHMVKVILNVPVLDRKLFLGEEFIALSSRHTELGEDAEGVQRVNSKISTEGLFLRDLYLNFSVYNVFNEKFKDPISAWHRQTALEQEGRVFWVKAVYGF